MSQPKRRYTGRDDMDGTPILDGDIVALLISEGYGPGDRWHGQTFSVRTVVESAGDYVLDGVHGFCELATTPEQWVKVLAPGERMRPLWSRFREIQRGLDARRADRGNYP